MEYLPQHITESMLENERRFQEGRADRKKNLPCRSANGAYLNGWYSPEKDRYYISKEDEKWLNKPHVDIGAQAD